MNERIAEERPVQEQGLEAHDSGLRAPLAVAD